MTLDTATFDLPPVAKIEDCQNLSDFLLQAVGFPVRLNAAAVKRVSGLAAQLIYVAKQKWAADGAEFHIVDASDAFRENMAKLGLEPVLGDTGDAE